MGGHTPLDLALRPCHARAVGSLKRGLGRRSGERGDLDRAITRLREILVSSKDFGEVSDYFHDVLVPSPAFAKAGSPADNDQLRATVAVVLEAVAPGGQLEQPMMMHLPAQGMWHGFAGWGGGHALFFYFEEQDMGLCCYSRDLRDPMTHFLRFSVVELGGATTLPGPVRRGSA